MPQHPPAAQLRSARVGRRGAEAALQYVRKLSGSARPSQANADAFDRAVGEVAAATRRLLDELVTAAPPKNREVEAAKARARAEVRYAR